MGEKSEPVRYAVAYWHAGRGARRDRISQLVFEIRNPTKGPKYSPQRAAEELADLFEEFEREVQRERL